MASARKDETLHNLSHLYKDKDVDLYGYVRTCVLMNNTTS